MSVELHGALLSLQDDFPFKGEARRYVVQS